MLLRLLTLLTLLMALPAQAATLEELLLELPKGSYDDRGKVVLMDRRLLTKPYGRRFLSALPDCALVIHQGGEEPLRIEAGEREESS